MLHCMINTKRRWLGGLDPIRSRRRGFGLNSHFTLPEEINAAIMGNAEQPGLQRATGVEFVQLAISLEQRLLHDIFAIHDGARHAGTVAVQARTKVLDRLEKRQVTSFEGARLMPVFRVAHNAFFRLWLTLTILLPLDQGHHSGFAAFWAMCISFSIWISGSKFLRSRT